jgi:hypothetical protein
MANKEEFWITNLSKMNVSLADLNLTVRPFSSINLLDSKHYSYNIDELEKSAKSGSLYKKSKLVSVRNNAPKVIKTNMQVLRTFYDKDSNTWSENGTFIPSRERSVLEITTINYEELSIDSIADKKAADEKFAADNADLASLDEQKIQKTKG